MASWGYFYGGMLLDKYELKLEEMLDEIKSCPNRTRDSCTQCAMYLHCDLRRRYVSSVYNSMSKGKNGGFEF